MPRRDVHHHGRRVSYSVRRNGGRKLLFVHGSGATRSLWKSQYTRLDRHTSVALDLSGHGDSDDISGGDPLDAYSRDVAAVARETDAEVLVGNSLGGAVLLHGVLEDLVEPEALVLVGTGAKLSVRDDLLELLSEDGDFGRFVDLLHSDDYLFHDAPDEVLRLSKRGMHDVGREITERDFRACNSFDVRDRLDEVDAPTLAVVGEHDSLTPVRYHEYLADEIDAAQLAVIDDAAHLVMLERPEEFNDALTEFVGSL